MKNIIGVVSVIYHFLTISLKLLLNNAFDKKNLIFPQTNLAQEKFSKNF